VNRLAGGVFSRSFPIAVLAVVGIALVPAAAQTSRADERARQQADKASRLQPYEASAAERLVRRAEHLLTGGSRGLYPWVGSVMGGGWLAAGAQLIYPFGDAGRLSVVGAWSLRDYRMLRAAVRLPAVADRRLTIHVDGLLLDANKVAFYGLGPRTSRHERSSYRIRPAEAHATLAVRVAGPLAAGAAVGILYAHTGDGALSPGVSQAFDAVSAPGLGASPHYRVTRAFASVDWREHPGYARRGGLYRAEWRRYAERRSDRLDFDQTELELQQLLPILRGQWVIALRGLAVFSQPADGGAVPYFLMPTLGGSNTVRGLPNHRLRDRNLLALQAEYRWTPSHFLDMALFADAGTVGPRRRDLALRNVRPAYGLGFRFHSASAVVFRTDVAWSREGLRVLIGSTAGF
jgi:hypothetical protein